MMRLRLRLFTGDDSAAPVAEQPVNVRLADISRALLDASRRNRSWLDDFADEEVQVSPDLYEILAAYVRMRPGA